MHYGEIVSIAVRDNTVYTVSNGFIRKFQKNDDFELVKIRNIGTSKCLCTDYDGERWKLEADNVTTYASGETFVFNKKTEKEHVNACANTCYQKQTVE